MTQDQDPNDLRETSDGPVMGEQGSTLLDPDEVIARQQREAEAAEQAEDEEDAEELEEARVEPLTSHGDLFAEHDVKISKTEYRGLPIEIRFYEIVRPMRQRALEEAVVEFRRRYPDQEKAMPIPSVFEKALVTQVIKQWNLGVTVRRGWSALKSEHDELAEWILKEIGAEDVVQSITGQVKTDKRGRVQVDAPEEAKKAKN